MGAGINDIPERRRASFPEIQDELFWELYQTCLNYSMMHAPGFINLYQSVRYIHASGLAGDFVECGCFLGGASIFMSLLRDRLGLADRTVWVFDTFEGFPADQQDALIAGGQTMTSIRFDNFLAAVKQNFEQANPGYRRVNFIEGFVEDTIPATDTGAIALLRLDTDFYLSTKAELEGLYPRLVRGGVLIIDDYGLFEGSRRATDEFLATLQSPPLLNRIDCAVWAGVKP